MTLPGHPEIFVVGDMMSLDRLPGVADVALQGGLYAAKKICCDVAGKPLDRPFKYRDLGSAAHISRGNAVLSIGKVRLSGFLGWLAWLFIHVGFLTGFRNRFGALMSWWLAFTRD